MAQHKKLYAVNKHPFYWLQPPFFTKPHMISAPHLLSQSLQGDPTKDLFYTAPMFFFTIKPSCIVLILFFFSVLLMSCNFVQPLSIYINSLRCWSTSLLCNSFLMVTMVAHACAMCSRHRYL